MKPLRLICLAAAVSLASLTACGKSPTAAVRSSGELRADETPPPPPPLDRGPNMFGSGT